MRTRTTEWIVPALLAGLLCISCGGGGGQAGPAAGSQEWYWNAAAENIDSGDFGKAAEHLEKAAKMDGPLQQKAAVYRTVVLIGLSRGALEMADAYRKGLETVRARSSEWQNPMQQALRDGRRYSIALAESMGAVDKALSADPVVLDFPFPKGAAARSGAIVSIQKGEAVAPAQLPAATEQAMRRGLIVTAVELSAKDEALAAQSAFSAGPVSVPKDEARLAMVTMLLDVSLLFDRLRGNEPEIRKIFLSHGEKWIQPYLEGEDQALKDRAAELVKEIEDERLDLEGKRRKLARRG